MPICDLRSRRGVTYPCCWKFLEVVYSSAVICKLWVFRPLKTVHQLAVGSAAYATVTTPITLPNLSEPLGTPVSIKTTFPKCLTSLFCCFPYSLYNFLPSTSLITHISKKCWKGYSRKSSTTYFNGLDSYSPPILPTFLGYLFIFESL